MRHRMSGRKFNRDSAERKALFNSLARALLNYEQITTTLPKARDLRPYVEKMLTLGKKGTLAGRRQLFADLRDRGLVGKVFGPLAQRYSTRNGGYTRIVKCGFRRGDAAPIAVIELVDRETGAKQTDNVTASSRELTTEVGSESAGGQSSTEVAQASSAE